MSPEGVLSDLDARILQRIQSCFPLAEDPYGILAGQVAATRREVHGAVQALRDIGIIRRIGGSYVPARLGYVTALVATEVDPARLDAVAAHVNSFATVTHNYERDARLNLWFTIIAPTSKALKSTVSSVAARDGVREIHALPALRTFKLRVEFAFDQHSADAPHNAASARATGLPCSMDTVAKRVIARSCGDIGAGLNPYDDMATELGICRDDLLERLRGFQQRGIMRRFGAMLRHQQAGYAANGMSVWNVPDQHVEHVGTLLAAQQEISHCYERARCPNWLYNVYGMIHGRTESAVRALARDLARKTGLDDYRILFSRREFKKTSMLYFAE